MARAACGVDHRDVLGARYFLELGFGVLVGLHEIRHVLGQLGIGPVEHPQAPERVLCKVAHDPVGREQLGCWSDGLALGLLAFLEAGEHLIFALADVVLVHPPHDFDALAPVLFGDGRHELLHDAAFAQEAVGKKKLHGPADFFEDGGHARGELIALRQEDRPEKSLVVAALDELGDLRLVERLEGQVHRLGKRLGPKSTICARKHADVAR